MTFVFDLDDTISRHRGRDFEHATPISATIEKIRQLHAAGHQIVVYSARGQNSCKGDLALIEERNREQVERWLYLNGVKYDRLVFGKPLGDVYVDDKGVALPDFLAGEYGELSGNSGAEIYRAGTRVIKKCGDAQAQADWYEEARSLGVRTPTVYSVVLGKVDMEYVEGEAGNRRTLEPGDICRIASIPMLFSMRRSGYRFDVNALVARAYDHLASARSGDDFRLLFSYLYSREGHYRCNASFCHGDLSLSNVIWTPEGPCLIDPIVKPEYSSYLLDLAKLMFSLDGGERFLHGGAEPIGTGAALARLTCLLAESGTEELVRALEAVYWIRLLKYTPEPERREKAIRKAKEIEAEL